MSIAIFTSPGPLLPQYTNTNQARFISRMIFDSLLDYDEKIQFQPSLAEKWSLSPDGRTYRFNLRKDVKWSDGQPFTARDVQYTVLNMADKASTNNWFVYVDPIVGARDRRAGKADAPLGITVIDDYSFEVTTEGQSGPFLENFGVNLRIYPRHILEPVPVADLPKHPYMNAPTVSTGPYKFVRQEADQFVELERNSNYFKGQPNIPKVFVKILKPETALAQLETGELDMVAAEGIANVPPAEVDRLKKISTLDIQSYPGTTLTNLTINSKQARFTKQMRQAIAYGIDRESIVTGILQNRGRVALGATSDTSPYFLSTLNPYKYDKAKAQQLLKEAGWDFSQEVGLVISTGDKAREFAGQVVLQSLQEAGVKIQARQMDLSSMVASARKGELDMFISSNAESIDPDLTRRFHSTMATAGVNLGAYNSPDADALMDKGAKTVELEARKPIYNQLQQLLNEDLPIIPLYRADDIGAVNKRVQGVKFSPVGILVNVHKWTISS